jgi:hypothetical protein
VWDKNVKEVPIFGANARETVAFYQAIRRQTVFPAIEWRRL